MLSMATNEKPSTLADQVKSAQRSMETWPEWLRDSAKFAGQPRSADGSRRALVSSDPKPKAD